MSNPIKRVDDDDINCITWAVQFELAGRKEDKDFQDMVVELKALRQLEKECRDFWQKYLSYKKDSSELGESLFEKAIQTNNKELEEYLEKEDSFHANLLKIYDNLSVLDGTKVDYEKLLKGKDK